MKPLTVKREPTPAERRRTAVARERVAHHLRGMLDGLDAETRVEACRAGIRALAQLAKSAGGEGRASGVLCGALVDVAPGYRTERPEMAAAEALFAKGGE